MEHRSISRPQLAEANTNQALVSQDSGYHTTSLENMGGQDTWERLLCMSGTDCFIRKKMQMRPSSDIWKEPCMLPMSALLQLCDRWGLVLARKWKDDLTQGHRQTEGQARQGLKELPLKMCLQTTSLQSDTLLSLRSNRDINSPSTSFFPSMHKGFLKLG